MGNTINVQGSYIDIHDNENVYLSVDKAEVRMGQTVADKGEKRPLSEVLMTEKARGLMESLVKAGMLDGKWQPVKLSYAKRGELAMQLALRLDINDVWQVFGKLWNMKPESLRAAFNKGREQKANSAFQERTKNILG